MSCKPNHPFPASLKNNQYRKALQEMVIRDNPKYFITVHFNVGGCSMDWVRAKIALIYRRAQKNRLGRSKRKAEDFDRAWFFVEKLSVSAHVHSFWTPSVHERFAIPKIFFDEHLRKEIGASNIDCKIHDGVGDIIYATKEVYANDPDPKYSIGRDYLLPSMLQL